MSLYLGSRLFVVYLSQRCLQRAITASSYYKSFPCNTLFTPAQTRKGQRDKRTKGQRHKGTKGQRDKGNKFQPHTQPLRTKKITQLLGRKKITQPLGTRQSLNLLGQKNHPTSRDNNKSCNLSGQKNATFQDKKHHATAKEKKSGNLSGKKKLANSRNKTKIMQPLGTKKSPNLLG